MEPGSSPSYSTSGDAQALADDTVSSMVDDGSWGDFWATLDDTVLHATQDMSVADAHMQDPNNTTPPPSSSDPPPPVIEVSADDSSVNAAVDELIADIGAEGSTGDVDDDEEHDVSSAEGTVEGTVEDDIQAEEDAMGMEG